ASDTHASARVVLGYSQCLERLPDDPATVLTAFHRVARLALATDRPPVRLPPAWSQYQEGSLVSFFASTISRGGAIRWIAQIHPLGTDDVFVCRITSSRDPVILRNFKPSLAEYRAAVAEWQDALDQAQKRFAHRQREQTIQVVETVDLEATTY